MKPTRLNITLEMKSRHVLPLSKRDLCIHRPKIMNAYVKPLYPNISIDRNISLIKGAYIPSMSGDISIGEKIYVSSYREKTSSRKMIVWNVESI